MSILVCNNCKGKLPQKARYCPHCGISLGDNYIPMYPLDINNVSSLPTQIRELFIAELQDSFRKEGNTNGQTECVNLLYDTDMHELMDERFFGLTQQIEDADLVGAYELDKLLEKNFHALIDYFIVNYASHLLPYKLSSRILHFAESTERDVNIRQLLYDYLNMNEERETWYDNIVAVPVKKLQKSIEQYFYYDKFEVPMLLCDQSISGSGKEGFAFTDKALYWKQHFHVAGRIAYAVPATIVYKKGYLEIDGQYFNANPSLNFKIYKLLLKLQRIFA